MTDGIALRSPVTAPAGPEPDDTGRESPSALASPREHTGPVLKKAVDALIIADTARGRSTMGIWRPVSEELAGVFAGAVLSAAAAAVKARADEMSREAMHLLNQAGPGAREAREKGRRALDTAHGMAQAAALILEGGQ